MRISETNNYEIIAKLNEPVQNLHASLYPEYFHPYRYDAVKDFFQNMIDSPSFIFLLLEESNQSVGYAWLELKSYPGNAFKKTYTSIYIHQISVLETYRNKGYGTQLLDYIYKIAKNKNINMIELDYWLANTTAKQFYAKNGFDLYREFVYKKI
ncbi:GNAT family N-acetyltransferase [Bacillus sp. S14(2024)]|uniref:GNAT family N-acetyltransferase n=1 Tax=Bacillus sp. S14(2024) TaxID=3162884 RepID=UPI003D1B1A97